MKFRKAMGILAICGSCVMGMGSAADALTISTEQPDGTVKYHYVLGDGRVRETVEPGSETEQETRGTSEAAQMPERSVSGQTQISGENVPSEAASGESVSSKAASDQSTPSESASDSDVSSEMAQRMDRAQREQMKESLAYLEKYGVSYDTDAEKIFYKGKEVRCITDVQELLGNGICIYGSDENGETGRTDLYTIRNAYGELTGVREATEEEYAAKTEEIRQMKTAVVLGPEETCAAVEDDLIVEAVTEGSFVCGVDVPGAEAEGNFVYSVDIPGAVTEDNFVYSVNIPGDACEVQLENAAEVTMESGWSESDRESLYLEQERERIREYERFGIVQSNSGGWLWNGRKVYMLLDDDGSISMNNSDDTRADRIYLYVERDEEGAITGVSAVDGREILQKKAELDAETDRKN